MNTARVNKQNEMGEVKQNTMNTGRNTTKIIQETCRLRHTDLTQGRGEKTGENQTWEHRNRNRRRKHGERHGHKIRNKAKHHTNSKR